MRGRAFPRPSSKWIICEQSARIRRFDSPPPRSAASRTVRQWRSLRSLIWGLALNSAIVRGVREVLYVALGGSLGAVSRYGISEWARRRLGDALPWGTLFVNVVGSLLLGLLLGLALREVGTRGHRAAFGTGFLGAFTTFSTFSNETVLMYQQGKLTGAVLNVVLNLVAGIGAAIAGLWLASKVPIR